jgi:hypothetical protein
LEGKADEVQLKHRSKERQAMLDLLKAFPQGLTAQEVAEHLGKNKYTARNLLKRMVDEQAITCTKGVFTFHHEEPADAEGKTADVRGYHGYRGYCNANGTENEPVEGDEGMNYSNHALTPTRGYRGSREECFHEEEQALNEPVEGDERVSTESNQENHENHETEHPRERNHGNHAHRDSSVPSHRSPQEWEEFIL